MLLLSLLLEVVKVGRGVLTGRLLAGVVAEAVMVVLGHLVSDLAVSPSPLAACRAT